MSMPARQTLRLIVLAIIIWLCWLAAPKSHGSQDNPTRAELLQTVRHISQLAQETQAELDAEKQAHSQTQSALDNSIKSNHDAQMQFASYQLAAEAQIKKGNEAIAQLNHVIAKLHLAKWILCGLWVACCAILIIQMPLAIKHYALIGGAGLAVAGCAFIWLWI